MELPRRARGDELLRPGELLALRRRVRQMAPAHDLSTVIAGGSHAVYEPYLLFDNDPDGAGGADVAVTGEEYVLLSLIEALLSFRARGESLRSAFYRARDCGALDGIPGLVYPRGEREGV